MTSILIFTIYKKSFFLDKGAHLFTEIYKKCIQESYSFTFKKFTFLYIFPDDESSHADFRHVVTEESPDFILQIPTIHNHRVLLRHFLTEREAFLNSFLPPEINFDAFCWSISSLIETDFCSSEIFLAGFGWERFSLGGDSIDHLYSPELFRHPAFINLTSHYCESFCEYFMGFSHHPLDCQAFQSLITLGLRQSEISPTHLVCEHMFNPSGEVTIVNRSRIHSIFDFKKFLQQSLYYNIFYSDFLVCILWVEHETVYAGYILPHMLHFDATQTYLSHIVFPPFGVSADHDNLVSQLQVLIGLYHEENYHVGECLTEALEVYDWDIDTDDRIFMFLYHFDLYLLISDNL